MLEKEAQAAPGKRPWPAAWQSSQLQTDTNLQPGEWGTLGAAPNQTDGTRRTTHQLKTTEWLQLAPHVGQKNYLANSCPITITDPQNDEMKVKQ